MKLGRKGDADEYSCTDKQAAGTIAIGGAAVSSRVRQEAVMQMKTPISRAPGNRRYP
jgi:hypothetical protein